MQKTPKDERGELFSEETMESLRELGAVLRSIHDDLIAQGYTIKDGEITPPEKGAE